MSAGAEALSKMIASLDKMQTLVSESMPALSKAVRTEMERTIAAGTTAEGKQWKQTQKGTRPLQHAEKTLLVMNVNKTIYITVSGYDARHHHGRVKGGVARPIVPTQQLPDAMADAMRAVLQQRFSDAVNEP